MIASLFLAASVLGIVRWGFQRMASVPAGTVRLAYWLAMLMLIVFAADYT